MATKVEGDVHCMVICGEWKCSSEGEWNIEIDKLKWSRIVLLRAGVKISDVEKDVSLEFGMAGVGATLSYWYPTSLGMMTGKRTPPVVVKSDVGYAYFLELIRSNKELNMFVNFDKEGEGAEPIKNAAEGSRKRVLGDISTCGSKNLPLTVEDDDFLEQLDKMEASVGVDRDPIVSDVNLGSSEGGEETEGSMEDWVTSDDEDEDVLGDGNILMDEEVDPGGYDKEFWSNFLDEEHGGSNAVEIMCTSNDCFDHTVAVGGVVKNEKKTNGSTGAMNGGLEDGNTLGMEDLQNEWIGTGGDETWMPWTAASGQALGSNGREKRKLEEVNDEEFDIPPMFDDTKYIRPLIPDLDREIGDDGKGIYKGKLYASKEDCQISLAIFAIKNMFNFTQSKTRRYTFVLSCTDKRCDWRVLAGEVKGSGCYEIRKAYLEHTCSIDTRGQFKKKASSRVIAAVFKSRFSNPSKGPTPGDLQQLVLEDLRVDASYSKCRRAKDMAIESIIGTDDDSYAELKEYLHVLKLANPGTVTELETVNDEGGNERFLYMFLAFGASIQGFRRLRLVLVVDGTHLLGKYKGVLLTASGQDANFQVFPLAFAIVDSENDAAWTWFFEKLERVIADSAQLTIISDRHKSIYKAKKQVFPLANHAACIVHLERNVTARFKSAGLAKMVMDAGYAYKLSKFKEVYKNIQSKSPACAKYLETIGLAHWSRVYFRGERYNLMTSNIAETLNAALVRGRGSPIVELLKFIRSMLTRWFSARRKKSANHRGPVPPEVDKEMTKNLKDIKGSRIGMVSTWSYEIVGPLGAKTHVMLDQKKCNCKEFDKLKIPCGHAMLAADSQGIPHSSLVGDYYKTSTWAATYEGVINPELDAKEVEIPEDIKKTVLFPPRSRRPSGRPLAIRIPSTGEIPKPKTARSSGNRCGRCRGVGHNRTKCKEPI